MSIISAIQENRKAVRLLCSEAPKYCLICLLALIVTFFGLWKYQNRFVFEPESRLDATTIDFPFSTVRISFRSNKAEPFREDLHGWWVPSDNSRAQVSLYLHGNAGNVSQSARDISPLRALGYSFLLLEYRGFGESKGAFPLTIAEYRGTYARGIGAGSEPEQARPEHMLIAVVAETPHGMLFFQLFGPIASVESQRTAYLAFVRALK